MFTEEEWTDSVPTEQQAAAGVKTEALSWKGSELSKKISKRCLMRTLQTLGSLPQWDSLKASDGSDGEVEDAPVHINKKKKKHKKRKKIPDTNPEEEQHSKVDVSEIPVKKRRTKQKQKEPDYSTSPELKENRVSVAEGRQKESTTENKLSRKKWRNKMKNKKRCKNKFLQNATEVAKVNLKGEKLGKTTPSLREGKMQGDSLSSEKMKLEEKNDIVLPINTHPSKNGKIMKKKKNKDKESNIRSHSKTTEDELTCKQPQKFSTAIKNPTITLELCEKRKPVKVDPSSLFLANKLKEHVAGVNKKLTEEKEESKKSKEERKSTIDRSSALRSRMEKRLESARFRYINELLYTSTSGEAKRMFQQDPDAIGVYHKGYTEQVKQWPANPVDSIISYIRQKPASLVVADFGCGDCKIAKSVKNKVHCFDLAPVCDFVTSCDMANVPLADSTVDIAVFCLSLMGTNLGDFLAEANRVLVDGGVLKIAEVASRFDDIRQFVGALSRLGFKLVSKDTENTHFYSFEFTKIRNVSDKMKKIGLQLKPCLYKKR
ncbi:uncharacterized protein rrp8 [Hoplias malabaricus]|uniref:uncharacterized protein rrp8 n=1 Tax=Hoplias malabaricus TaxID=27720 RepID=UPI003463068E